MQHFTLSQRQSYPVLANNGIIKLIFLLGGKSDQSVAVAFVSAVKINIELLHLVSEPELYRSCRR